MGIALLRINECNKKQSRKMSLRPLLKGSCKAEFKLNIQTLEWK